jgi:hypothetical protein
MERNSGEKSRDVSNGAVKGVFLYAKCNFTVSFTCTQNCSLSDTLDNVFGIGCVVWILLLFGREK